MVTVQRRLGHSSIRVTSDIYTTVLAEVEREAAEATVSVVPRSRKRVIPQPEASDKAAPSDEEQDGRRPPRKPRMFPPSTLPDGMFPGCSHPLTQTT